jgi:hypothetical protein
MGCFQSKTKESEPLATTAEPAEPTADAPAEPTTTYAPPPATEETPAVHAPPVETPA